MRENNRKYIWKKLTKFTYVWSKAFGVRVIDVNSGEDFIKTGPVLWVDNHLVHIEVKEYFVLISPDLRR